MNFLDYPFDARTGDVIEVSLDKQANVRLLDEHNFSRFRSGSSYRGHAEHARHSPVLLPVPSTGRWHAIVDLGGRAGTVRASARVIRQR